MKDLNIKKMIKDMSFHDKAKMLFADYKLQYDTDNKERVLTPEEENDIVKNCREKNEIAELNKLIDLYNMIGFVAIDINTAILNLRVVVGHVNMLVLAMMLSRWANEDLEKMVYLIRSKKGKEFKELATEIAKNKRGIFQASLYAFFDPSDEEPESNNPKEQQDFFEKREPNLSIQKVLCRAVSALKHLKKTVYIIDYICKKGGIDFVCKRHQEILDEAKKEMEEFESLDGFLRIVNVYSRIHKDGLMRQENLTEPVFLKLLIDPKAILALTEQDKRAQEQELDAVIERHS